MRKYRNQNGSSFLLYGAAIAVRDHTDCVVEIVHNFQDKIGHIERYFETAATVNIYQSPFSIPLAITICWIWLVPS